MMNSVANSIIAGNPEKPVATLFKGVEGREKELLSSFFSYLKLAEESFQDSQLKTISSEDGNQLLSELPLTHDEGEEIGEKTDVNPEELSELLNQLTEVLQNAMLDVPPEQRADLEGLLADIESISKAIEESVSSPKVEGSRGALQCAPTESEIVGAHYNAPLQETSEKAPTQEAIKTIEANLDKVPPEAQEALKKVLEKLQDKNPEKLPSPQKASEATNLEEAPEEAQKVLKEVLGKLQTAADDSTKIKIEQNDLKAQQQQSENRGQSSINSKSSMHEQLVEQIQKAIEKVPPEAKKLLEDLLAKFQSTEGNTGKLKEKTLVKSIQQMEIESSLGKQSSLSVDRAITSAIAPIEQQGVVTVDPADSGNLENFRNNSSRATAEIQPPSSVMESKPESCSGIVQKAETALFSSSQNSHEGKSSELPHEQIVTATKLTLESGKKEISIKLKPDELGEVRIKLASRINNEVSIRMITETGEAKEALEKNLGQLLRSFEDSGIRVGKVSIIQAGAEIFDSRNQQFNQNSSSGQSYSNQSSQQQHHQQQQQWQNQSHSSHSFMESDNPNSNPFRDEGSPRQAGEEASSKSSFDTDVEGEEVYSDADTAKEPVITRSRRVDVRV